jgi:release factor glutamine methyltransferase
VLIPRPETEELVTWMIEDIKKEKTVLTETGIHPLRILDIGTGSGCIAITLKKNIPEIEMTAIDKSNEALQVAKKNAVLNQVDIDFIEADMTNDILISQLPDLDIIVSNPPYVPVREKKDMQPQVALYEPSQALFVPDDDPLLFYKAIFKIAAKKLVNNGSLYLEIHRDYGTEIMTLMNQYGFEKITLRKDMAENERMVKGIKE